jgi:citrate lyase subunit beta / citryl-CoA lyase
MQKLPGSLPRPRRGSLFVPASSPRMLEKAAGVEADEVVLDLEDSVAADRKDQARDAAVGALRGLAFSASTVAVRVNAVGTPAGLRDLLALAAAGDARLDALVVPKVESAADVHAVARVLDALELEAGGARRLGLVLQLESAAGVLALGGSAGASSRLEALAFGPGDYAADLGVESLVIGASDPAFPGHQWAWPMAAIANHARAAGVQAIDGPYADVHDEAAFRASAAIAGALGYDGKHCIHPRQVPWAIEAFTPSDQRVAAARRLLNAVGEAAAEGRGAALLDGRMIDEASRRMAERLLARAG